MEIFQVKAWLATFKARNANLNLFNDIEKEKTTRSTWGGRSRPPPSIDRRSPQPRSLQVSIQICRVWFLSMFSLLKKAFYYPRSLTFFRLSRTEPNFNFSGLLEASWKRPADGASTVCRLSLWLTRFSCILVMGRK